MMPLSAAYSGILTVHASTLTCAVGITLAAAVLVLANGLVGAKLSVLAKEQKAQMDLARAKATWGGKMAAFQTYKTQDKTAASY